MTALLTSPPFLLAIAATSALVGSVWQCVLAVLNGVESMEDFLGAHNRLIRDERNRLLATIPSWRLLRRRRASRLVLAEAKLVLTRDELKRNNAYDRQAWAWSCVITGALIASIVSWVQVAAS